MAKTDGLHPEFKKLRKLVKGFRVAMLTTVAPDGALRSRPMATVRTIGEGDVWFLTKAGAPKVDEVEEDQRVSVSYASDRDETYVSLSGTAHLVRDPERVLALWRPRLKKWFPDGKRDLDLVAMQVRIERAEYWDKRTSQMLALESARNPAGATDGTEPGAAARIADAMKAIVTGNEAEEAEKPTTPGGAQG